MGDLSRCSTCGYRWVSAGWTCPRCGYAPEPSGYDNPGYAGESGCTESCLLPLGCLGALVEVPVVLVLLLAAANFWQTWVVVGVAASVAVGVALYRWWENR